MRLTLRTLLAYLDDILPPSQAREIGAKVTDSPDAAKLMQRVRDVVRRRRVSAPALSGPGSGPDPNVVAEYLDNSLAPQTVIELEKICLGSDVHLAEVAACHTILSLVLSDPVEVSADMRDRLHALGVVNRPSPVRQPDAHFSNDVPLSNSVDVLVQAPDAASASQPQPAHSLSGTMDVSEMTSGIPDYLRNDSNWKRKGMVAFVVCVVAAWFLMIIFDSTYASSFASLKNWLFGDAAVAVADSDAPPAASGDSPVSPVSKDANVGAAAATPRVKVTPPSTSETPNASAVVATTTPVTPEESVTVVKPDQPATEATVVVVEPVEPMPADAAAGVDMPPVAPAEGNALAVAPAVPDAAPAAPIVPLMAMYTSAEGVALVSSPMQPEWFVLPRRALLHDAEAVAVPTPYEASFLLSDEGGGDAGMEVRVLGDTVVSRIEPKGMCRIAFEVQRGRMILSRPLASDKTVKVLLRVQGREWQVDLTHPGTVCGVQVLPPLPAGPPGAVGGSKLAGGVLAAQGEIAMGSLGGQREPFRAGEGWIGWPEPGEALKADSPTGIPDWLTPGGVVVTPSARQLARAFEKEFALDKPVAAAIPAVIENRQAKLSELATKTVALLGLYRDLVTGLRSEHEEARLAAIDGLREWLPQSPENADLLQEQLAKFYLEEDVQAVMRLLWGFSGNDARIQEPSQQLVAWLGDDDVSIRELAFYQVFRLTGKKYDYRPNLLPQHLQAAVLRWQDHLQRNNGLLIAD